jgi:transcriptional regulator with XRE-family HTH domain
MATRKSGPLDATVGARIRMFRVDRGMSQTMLAERIGVTFQQVQKYERGANRVGASRLSQIAYVLGVSVGELFESSRAESPRLEFTGSLARRAGRLARSQGLCANDQSARAALHRKAG